MTSSTIIKSMSASSTLLTCCFFLLCLSQSQPHCNHFHLYLHEIDFDKFLRFSYLLIYIFHFGFDFPVNEHVVRVRFTTFTSFRHTDLCGCLYIFFTVHLTSLFFCLLSASFLGDVIAKSFFVNNL